MRGEERRGEGQSKELKQSFSRTKLTLRPFPDFAKNSLSVCLMIEAKLEVTQIKLEEERTERMPKKLVIYIVLVV